MLTLPAAAPSAFSTGGKTKESCALNSQFRILNSAGGPRRGARGIERARRATAGQSCRLPNERQGAARPNERQGAARPNERQGTARPNERQGAARREAQARSAPRRACHQCGALLPRGQAGERKEPALRRELVGTVNGEWRRRRRRRRRLTPRVSTVRGNDTSRPPAWIGRDRTRPPACRLGPGRRPTDSDQPDRLSLRGLPALYPPAAAQPVLVGGVVTLSAGPWGRRLTSRYRSERAGSAPAADRYESLAADGPAAARILFAPCRLGSGLPTRIRLANSDPA